MTASLRAVLCMGLNRALFQSNELGFCVHSSCALYDLERLKAILRKNMRERHQRLDGQIFYFLFFDNGLLLVAVSSVRAKKFPPLPSMAVGKSPLCL